jgi:hypothetical protein
MGVIATALKHLIAAGVSGDALITAIADIELSQKAVKSTNAERQKRYRERKALQNNVTLRNAVTNITENASHIENARAPDSLFLPSEVILSKKESKKESKITASRFSLDALPSEWESFCRVKRPDLDPQNTFDAFRDWWTAAPGGKGLKADWAATWRNWVRNQKYHNGNPYEYRKIPDKHQQILDAAAEALRDHRAAAGEYSG